MLEDWEQLLPLGAGGTEQGGLEDLLGPGVPAQVDGEYAAFSVRARGERRTRRHPLPGGQRRGVATAVQLAQAELVSHLAIAGPAGREPAQPLPCLVIKARRHLLLRLVEHGPQSPSLHRSHSAPHRHGDAQDEGRS